MDTEIFTYADGHGTWHAVLKYRGTYAMPTKEDFKKATTLVHEELKQRYTTTTGEKPSRPRLKLHAVEFTPLAPTNPHAAVGFILLDYIES